MRKQPIRQRALCLVVSLFLLLAGIPLTAAAENGAEAAVDPAYTLAADSNGLRLYYHPGTGDIAVATAEGHVWYSAVQSSTLDLDSLTESQRLLLTAPLTVEYTLLNSRSDKSERKSIKDMDLTVTAEKVKNGVKLTYTAASMALEIDLLLTLDDNGLTAAVPEDGIREGVGLEERLEKSMTTIRSNIDYIYGTIDQHRQIPGLLRRIRQADRVHHHRGGYRI